MRHLRTYVFVALVAALALVLAACGEDPVAVDEPEDVQPEPDVEEPEEVVEEDDEEVVEEEEEEVDEEEAAIWTMFEVWEQDPEQEERLRALREIAAEPGQPVELDRDDPVQIAFVYPSFDLSEGWARGAIAFEARLEEFGFPFEITEFGSEIDQHDVQATHLEAVMAGDYEYAFVGPTELDVQRTLLREMIDDPDLHVIVWNYTTPIRDWDEPGQPLSYVGFDHAEGGDLLCDWVVEETGGEGDFVTMRFSPGFLDDQRVGTFSDCAEEAGMSNVYDHFADGTREQAYEGTVASLASHPDMVHIHASNTATAMGALAALREQGRENDILLNGWGGTGDELDAILEGGLEVTPTRMADDFGVFPAEIIRMHLMGEEDQIPLVAAGEMTLVDYTYSAEQIDETMEYAFRYSGELER